MLFDKSCYVIGTGFQQCIVQNASQIKSFTDVVKVVM